MTVLAIGDMDTEVPLSLPVILYVLYLVASFSRVASCPMRQGRFAGLNTSSYGQITRFETIVDVFLQWGNCIYYSVRTGRPRGSPR
jgi:hypothetical protein